MHQKKPRKKDRKLLDSYHEQPCSICGRTPSDPDHIKTRGSGGHDTEDNIWPLCRAHHALRHNIGLTELVKRYPKIEGLLRSKGWK